jgi:hypothetical protein
MRFRTASTFRLPCRKPAQAAALSRSGAALFVLACQAGVVAQAAEAPSAAPRPRIVDPAIQPAGGVSCTACETGGCRHSHGGLHGHHGGCRDGVCVPYCPVRPHQFGFYGTQWRRWPGQQIVPVSAERDAVPVSPPRSAVPGPTEESMNPQGDDQTGAADPSDSTPAPLPPSRQPLPEPTEEPGRLQTTPESRPQPEPALQRDPEPKQEPARVPPAEPAAESPATPPAQPDADPGQPAPETKPRPEDENLFEVLSGWRARRTFPVGKAGGSDAATTEAGVAAARRVGHTEAAAVRAVPRVPFDPAAETRRLRNTR